MPPAAKLFVVLGEKTNIELLDQYAGDLCNPIISQQLEQNFISNIPIYQTSLILFASKDYDIYINRFQRLIFWPLPETFSGITLRK